MRKAIAAPLARQLRCLRRRPPVGSVRAFSTVLVPDPPKAPLPDVPASLKRYVVSAPVEKDGKLVVEVTSPEGGKEEHDKAVWDLTWRTEREKEAHLLKQQMVQEAMSKADEEKAAELMKGHPGMIRVTSMEDYEFFLYKRPELLVCFFTASFSLWSKILAPRMEEMAKTYPKHIFLSIDTDACPRAAYHADVDDVPTVVVMKNDDGYRVKVTPENRCEFESIIARAKAAIDGFVEPSTGVASKMAWLNHNISVDNLNLKRINWPTQ
ncbi:unnamed protein product [Vitrella brassicaformis CCMP3155]|uniref:Thioredoxin domain-containing protein n=2 Tax=Vitrella brassicaformis TaxID=1169539 RepID=A0A0G4FBS9_VITBC|nr:unnamed protein product [Vitrella brassicaformis CCMP3155]|eukprot:CEM10617.1 unnamed protein product [Vitrella brassicaformis CCMP3155]